MRIRNLHIILITFLFVFLSNIVFGQMANYKSLYVYNFIKRIEWPSSEENRASFNILVIGDNTTADAIHQISLNKKSGTRIIEVFQNDNPESFENIDLIYVGYSKRKELDDIALKIGSAPILLVSDYKHAKESDINFMETSDGLEFTIRPKKIRKKGLKINDSLILLGKQEDD